MPQVSLVNAVFPSSVRIPPQGLLYLAGALEASGVTVEVRDYQLCPDPCPQLPQTFAAFLAGSGPIIGISCMSYVLPLVLPAIVEHRRTAPDAFIVLGGIGPSPIAAALMEYCP